MKKAWLLLLTLRLLISSAMGAEEGNRELVVLAASSLTESLQTLSKQYEQESGQRIRLILAASSTLARQLEEGAPGDVFISADTDWMDYLAARDMIDATTRRNLLGNDLVLVAAADNKSSLKIADGFGLRAALGKARLSIGEPGSVPAGKYAREALTSLHVWTSVADRLVLGDNVRTTLNFVSRGDAPFGIVYRTDALIDKNVRIVDTFPGTSHTAIVYPIATLNNAPNQAKDFVSWLSSASVQTVFKQYGFRTLP